MSSDENKAIVRRYLEAPERRDFEALKEHPGLYQTVERQPMVRAAFPDLQTRIEQQIAEGDTVATRGTMEGTQGGVFMGVAPTNKHLTPSCSWIRSSRARLCCTMPTQTGSACS